MRLGQLARKLALRPDQIVEFLGKHNIQIDEGSNTRLDDDFVALIVARFAPQGLELNSVEPIQDIDVEPIPQKPEVVATEIVQLDEFTVSPPAFTPAVQEENIEVIKAPKVELSGLKVLGKIELPEKKKKEDLPTEPKSANTPSKEPWSSDHRRPVQARTSRAHTRPAKNPIALQREQEEAEAARKREAARLAEKEKRSQHYFNKVKVVAPVKSGKREQIIEENEEPMPQPKTWLGRFFRWFTS